MPYQEKSFLDHVTDWFKVLTKYGGIPALLIGFGWVSVFFGSIWLGATWSAGPGFWVCAVVGVMMILLGYQMHKRELVMLQSEEG